MNGNILNPFDAVARERIILEIYDRVDPLDGWLDDSTSLYDPDQLWVDTIDPSVIDLEWYLNGALVAGAFGETFRPLDFGLGPGEYDIRAHSFDATDWVRLDRSTLEQDIHWHVILTVPEPGTLLLVYAGAVAIPIRRRGAASRRA